MNTYSYDGEDFKVAFQTDAWKIGLLRYSERFSDFKVMERHLKTPEIFVLLSGSATLYISKADESVETTVMEANKVYEVPAGEWHHITVSSDATVLVVENSDTSKENTEKVMID